MRARVIVPIVVVAVVGGVVALASSRRDASGSNQNGALTPRTVEAGGVEVTIVPVRLDDSGAVFRISLDTHMGDLGADLTRTGRLAVNGASWGTPTWDGDPPGGHHREGQLTFEPAGPATGTVRLTIDGFDAPVVAEWTVPAA